MEYRKLGNTDLYVSKIGFGGWGISGAYDFSGKPAGAGNLPFKQVIETLDLSISAGMNLFDTSANYGLSETYLGEWMRGRGIRGRIVLSTKCGLTENGLKDLSKNNMERSLAGSLNKLRTDYIDIYSIISVNSIKQWECALNTLEVFRKRGSVRYTGVSANNIEELRWAAGCSLIDVIHFSLNLFDAEKINYFIEKGTAGKGLIVKSPLSKGVLSGKYSKDSVFPKDDVRSSFLKEETLKKRMRWLQSFKREFEINDENLLETATRFIFTYKEPDSVLFSFKTTEQIERVLKAMRKGSLEQGTHKRIAGFSLSNQKMLDEYFCLTARERKNDAGKTL